MRFIGGKNLMLDNIICVLRENTSDINIIADIFSGSGVVASCFKNLGFKVIANDIMYFSYVFFYDILYCFFWNRQRKNEESDAFLLYILIGSVLVYACGIFDVLDTMIFHQSFHLFIYSAFVYHIGMAFTLSQRFRGMYEQLETTVQERNQLLGQIETMLSQTAVVPKSLAKGSLSFDIISGRAFCNANGANTDLLLTPKEFAVLLLLTQNENEPITAEAIYENVWKLPLGDDKNALKNTLSKMRKKIEPSGYTVSVSRGEGYIFERI
jgi:hypothetical protein